MSYLQVSARYQLVITKERNNVSIVPNYTINLPATENIIPQLNLVNNKSYKQLL